eukprot:COSAG01_NODE_51838_length_351_cov_1.234127_2_plen_32_part_01
MRGGRSKPHVRAVPSERAVDNSFDPRTSSSSN